MKMQIKRINHMNNCCNSENLGLIRAIWLVGDVSENTVLIIKSEALHHIILGKRSV